MTHVRSTNVMHPVTPRVWRVILVALCTLILCSCHGPQSDSARQQAGRGDSEFPGHPPTVPAGIAPAPGMPGAHAFARPDAPGAVRTSYLQAPGQPAADPEYPTSPSEPPLPYQPVGAWIPPGVAAPWPPNEYLADGGDGGLPAGVRVRREGTVVRRDVVGVEMEDTIAHFDAPDGRTLVEPSNRVNIYSPRFRSVRQVVNLLENEQRDASMGLHRPEQIASHGDAQSLGRHKQNVRVTGSSGQKSLTTYRTRQGDSQLSLAIGLRTFQDSFLPYENLMAIRSGKFASSEMAWLGRGTQAAITWEHVLGVQVLLDGKQAAAVVRNQSVDAVYSIEEPPARPQLRILKVASTPFAEPGEKIDFTIRFDNIGNQTLSNVTLIDNLAPRLQYVPNTAQSSVDAQFTSQVNEGESLVLKWELGKPLESGQGGLVRFTCVVR